MSYPEINPVPPWIVDTSLAIFAVLSTFLTTLYFNLRAASATRVKAVNDENDTIRNRLIDLETKMALLNAAVVPISTAFQAILIKELTHFHTPEMDKLLVKVGPPNSLTPRESERLAVMLQERTRDLGSEISQSERDAAYILPAVMKRAQLEQDALREVSELNMIPLIVDPIKDRVESE